MTTPGPLQQPAGDDDLERAREELLALMLAESASEEPGSDAPIPRIDRSSRLPLSSAQERIWFLEQFDPGSPLHNFHGVLRMRGELDVEALRQALGALVARHEVLRTTIGVDDGVPFQSVGPIEPVAMPVVDLGTLPAAEVEPAALEASRDASRQPWDLARGPLLRARLLRLAPDEHWLLLTLHHIACDSWSSGVLFGELAGFYRAFRERREPDLPELPIQYADFAAWQRAQLDSGQMRRSTAYWSEKLAGELLPLELPTDRPRPSVLGFEGAREHFRVPAATGTRIRQLASTLGITPFVVLLAALRVLLRRYTGQEDLLIGCPFADRPHVDTEPLVGVFVNNVVMRTPLQGGLSFREVLALEQRTFLEASEHRNVPFERLVQVLHPDRDRSRTPLFQAMFAFLNAPPADVALEGLTLTPVVTHAGTSEFDLSLYLEPDPRDPGAFAGSLEYSTALFEAPGIAAMAGHFVRLLDAATGEPDRCVDGLPLMDEVEWHRVIGEWNHTAAPAPGPATVHAWFEATAQADPGATALVACNATLTYRELNERANRVAHLLRSLGVAPDSGIGIMTDRTAEMVVGLLAILKAGCGYVPLDPSFPPERVSYMVEDSGVAIVLTVASLAQRLEGRGVRALCLDRDAPLFEALAADDPEPVCGGDSLAYTIYTSGSTGRPKGVEIEHRNVVNFLASILREPGLAPGDRLLAVTTISFDIHVLEIFGPLVAGATVVLATRDECIDGRRLHDLMEDQAVSVMQATPATWRLLLEVWTVLEPPRLRRLLCGGEGFPRPLADALLPLADEVWNMYGPTETTVWSACGRVGPGASAPSVGRPMANTATYVLDPGGQPLPAGVWGELFIGGDGVARGYLRRPELTGERFVADPFRPGGRMYRTGDRARWRRDGTLEIGTRTDSQIKIRGYRVELGEIETALAAHAGVRMAVAQVREDRPGDQRLVAYLVEGDRPRPDAASLRELLLRSLPDYMVPVAWVWLDALPLTPNGKIDRKSLPAPDGSAERPADGHAEPATEMEKLVAGLFAEVLGVERVGRYDNFFALGGHSLLAMKVVDRFGRATGRPMQPGELYQQTVGQIAAHHAGSLPAAEVGTGPAAPRTGRLRSALGGLFDRRGRA